MEISDIADIDIRIFDSCWEAAKQNKLEAEFLSFFLNNISQNNNIGDAASAAAWDWDF